MDIHITDLKPPMMVSGTTSKHESDGPLFAFENGLAVTLTSLTANGQSYYTYTVIMSDGQVHDVDSRDITSAFPYQPQHDTRVVDVRKSRAALVTAEVAEMSDDMLTRNRMNDGITIVNGLGYIDILYRLKAVDSCIRHL